MTLTRVNVIHRLPQIHFGVERTQFYQNPLPHRLANLFKSSLIRHEMPVRGRVLEKPVSKATTTLYIPQNLVFSFHCIFLYHSLYRTWEMTRGEGRDEKHLACLYRCKFKYRQKTMEVQWLIRGRYLLTFMAKYRIVLSNLQYFIKPDIPLYGFLRQYL